LIVAIILTKIILKDPDANAAALNDDTAVMIDPELTLEEDSDEKAKGDDDQEELSKMIESEIKGDGTTEIKEETVTIEESPKTPQAEPKAAKPEPVRIGPYKSREAADRAIVRVRDLINKSAFVVKK